jgi:hypothetical protein
MSYLRWAVFALAGSACLGTANVSLAQFTLTPFVNPSSTFGGVNGTIGFAYAGNKFVGSLQAGGNTVNSAQNILLYSTDLSGGSVALFAPGVDLGNNPSGEHFLSSSLGLGGFPNHDIYAADGNTTRHISNSGADLGTFGTGIVGNVRGILFDAVGTFGNNMIITTDQGNVYKVNSAGVATLLDSTGVDTEGLDIAPLNLPNGNPYSGDLFVASEGAGTVRVIDHTSGKIIATFAGIVASAEELSFVPLNLGSSGNPVEGFYGADYTPDVLKAPASAFAGRQGDIVVTGETTHNVTDLHWDGSTYVSSSLGIFPNQPEDGIFVTADIINTTSGTPEPASIVVWTLLGLSCVSAGYWRRGRKQVVD